MTLSELIKKVENGHHVVLRRRPCDDCEMTWEFKTLNDKVRCMHYIVSNDTTVYQDSKWRTVYNLRSVVDTLWNWVGMDVVILDGKTLDYVGE